MYPKFRLVWCTVEHAHNFVKLHEIYLLEISQILLGVAHIYSLMSINVENEQINWYKR